MSLKKIPDFFFPLYWWEKKLLTGSQDNLVRQVLAVQVRKQGYDRVGT